MWRKLENPPPRDPFQYILNSEASLHSLLSFAWTLTRPKNYLRQNIGFSYSEMIRVSFSLFLVFFVCFCFCFSLLFYFIINVYKNYFINFFFHENYFNFFMFRDVPGCSGMFVRNVPCSGFYRRPTQRYFQLVVASLLPSEYIEDITWQRGDIRILSSSERYFQHEILSQNACHKNVMKLGYKVIKEK